MNQECSVIRWKSSEIQQKINWKKFTVNKTSFPQLLLIISSRHFARVIFKEILLRIPSSLSSNFDDASSSFSPVNRFYFRNSNFSRTDKLWSHGLSIDFFYRCSHNGKWVLMPNPIKEFYFYLWKSRYSLLLFLMFLGNPCGMNLLGI